MTEYIKYITIVKQGGGQDNSFAPHGRRPDTTFSTIGCADTGACWHCRHLITPMCAGPNAYVHTLSANLTLRRPEGPSRRVGYSIVVAHPSRRRATRGSSG